MDYLISRISKAKVVAEFFAWLWLCIFNPFTIWVVLSETKSKNKGRLLGEINNNNVHEEVWLGNEEENNFVVADDITQDD